MSTTQLLPIDALSPSVTIIKPSQVYTGEKLNKLKANYRRWHDHADLFLISCSLHNYIDGSIPIPGINESCALVNWQTNDPMAITMVFGTLEESKWEFLDCSLSTIAY